MAHQTKGDGLVVMTNEERDNDLIEVICQRVQRFFDWDMRQLNGELRFAVPRGVGCLLTLADDASASV